ncbi:MAG: DUF1311 domain-containing protein [Comamonas sp.]|nr:DUF1311 domain-containing protein [Comamonas sp.]
MISWIRTSYTGRPKAIVSKAMAAMVLTAFQGLQAHAQAGSDCVPGGTVSQTNACAVKAFQLADTDNQILYGDVMRALSAHERPTLRKDQAEWTRHRIQQCKQAQAGFEAQQDWPRRYHECLVQQIKARDAVLKRWLHQGPPQ